MGGEVGLFFPTMPTDGFPELNRVSFLKKKICPWVESVDPSENSLVSLNNESEDSEESGLAAVTGWLQVATSQTLVTCASEGVDVL